MGRKTRFIIAGMVIVVGAASAVAAVGPRRHWHGDRGPFTGLGDGSWGLRGAMEMLKQLDADKDGSVTLAEFVAPTKTEFDRIDANKDGVLSTDEIEASIKETVDYWARRFVRRLDKDKDGRISLEEFRSGPRARFAARDLNADGQLTSDDLPPWRRGRVGAGDDPDAKKGEGRWTLERLLGRVDAAFKRLDANGDGFIDASEVQKVVAERVTFGVKRFMARFDADKDGRVTRAEFERFARARFADLDLNDDGRITEEDLPPRMRGKGILR